MPTFLKCKICGIEFQSPISLASNREDFEKQAKTTVSDRLRNNKIQCSVCRKLASYDGKDSFWRD